MSDAATATAAPSCYEFRFSMRLLAAGPNRLKTMAALRQLRPDLTLKEAKTLMHAIPCIVMTNITIQGKEEARQPFIHVAEIEFFDENRR